MQAMVPDYGKLWYDDKAVANIFSLTNFSINTDLPMTHTNMMLLLFTPIDGSSSSGKVKMSVCLQDHIYYRKLKYCHHRGKKYGGIHKQTNREGQVSQEIIQ